MSTLESNLFAPNGTFLVLLLVCIAAFGLLVVWPLAETIVRQQWGYALAVLFPGPIGGLVWFLGGRRPTARQRRPRRSPAGAADPR